MNDQLIAHGNDIYRLSGCKLLKVKSGDYYFDSPIVVKEYETEPTPEQAQKEAMLNDWSRWNLGLVKGSEPVEISEHIYWDMLGCMPPRRQQGSYFEVGEPHHHTNEGRPVHRAFWKENELFYTGYPK